MRLPESTLKAVKTIPNRSPHCAWGSRDCTKRNLKGGAEVGQDFGNGYLYSENRVGSPSREIAADNA